MARIFEMFPGAVGFFLAAATVLAISVGEVSAHEKPLPGLADVLAELRLGGLIIYMRHALTDHATRTEAVVDFNRCETQRNLSAAGREQAATMGRAAREMKIPIGAVLSSPYCRCTETARLAFGRAAVQEDLKFAMETSPEDTARLAQALRRMLSTAPEKGTNTVIVAHTANLREAAGLWPKPEGAAYVFRPLPDGRFEALARIAPEDWMRAATATGPVKKAARS